MLFVKILYWKNQGIVINSKLFQENKYIIKILTQNGIWNGMYTKNIEISSVVTCSWSARLEDQLGKWTIQDVSTKHFSCMFRSKLIFHSIIKSCQMCNMFLKERNPDSTLFDEFLQLISVSCFMTEYYDFLLALARFQYYFCKSSGVYNEKVSTLYNVNVQNFNVIKFFDAVSECIDDNFGKVFDMKILVDEVKNKLLTCD